MGILDTAFVVVAVVGISGFILLLFILWWAVRSLEVSLQYELNLYTEEQNYEADFQVQRPSTGSHRDHDA